MEPEIVNVVATTDLKQRVDLMKVSRLPHTIHDQEIYGGRVAYLNTPEMHGKVTIFPSGKLISVGTKSPRQAEDDLKITHDVLTENDLIEPIQSKTTLRNLVAVLRLDRPIHIESIPTQLQAIYEPEQFPGAIIKSADPKATYIVFSSGKIVITGTRSPQELHKAARARFPEDEVERLGKSGETDIIVRPLHNGIRIGHEVFIESKTNKNWSRSFIDQTRRHMSSRGCSYAILAVETMPAGARGYLTEYTDSGTIFVTGRKTCILAYGALKAVMINEYLLGRKEINLKAALADTRVREAISTIFTTTDSIEAMRKKTKKIIQSAKGINSDIDEIEDIIKNSIREIQRTINQAIETRSRKELQVSSKRTQMQNSLLDTM